MSKLIGIVGKAKAGKNTAVQYLTQWDAILAVAFTMEDMLKVKEKGGIIVRINRPRGMHINTMHNKHVHKELDCQDAIKLVDYVIDNSGTIADLYKELDKLALKLGLVKLECSNAESKPIDEPVAEYTEPDPVPVVKERSPIKIKKKGKKK